MRKKTEGLKGSLINKLNDIIKLTKKVKDCDADIAIHDLYGYDVSNKENSFVKPLREELKKYFQKNGYKLEDLPSEESSQLKKALNAAFGNCWEEKESLEKLFS